MIRAILKFFTYQEIVIVPVIPNFFTPKLETQIFPSQPKPNPNKNFFQNYYDHVHQLAKNYAKNYEDKKEEFFATKNQLEFLSNQALKHLSIFNALYDVYDYTDEIAGATVTHWLGTGIALVLAATVPWELAQALVININWAKDDREDHVQEALLSIVAAALLFLLTTAIFIRSVISLVTRPLVTVVCGYQQPKENRFYDESVASPNNDVIEAIVDTVADPFSVAP